jgi:xanthine phosphoribosyltransferase
MKTLYTWYSIYSRCEKIVKELKEKYTDIMDYEIVGISRGGLVPAVIISNLLGIRKVYSFGLKTYKDQEKESAEIYQIPYLANNNKILLIDDISDTGESFEIVKKLYSHKELITVSVYMKEKTKFAPDVVGENIDNNIWVVFPWEP